MVKRVIGSLGALFSDAQERGTAMRNPVRERAPKKRRADIAAEKRAKGRLQAGIDIPLPEEIKALVAHLAGRWRPLLLTACFTGLRASELRGLRWSDVDLDKRVLHVRQRADRFNAIGRPKSLSGVRQVPLPPIVANTLKEWQLACPRQYIGRQDEAGQPVRELVLCFPNGNGGVESHANIVNRGLIPSMIAAGITVDLNKRDAGGKPILGAKYTGLHCLRHFFASWLINRRVDGGLELPPKTVQERLGHSSIVVTLDTYGHLFPRADDADELAAAERLLLG